MSILPSLGQRILSAVLPAMPNLEESVLFRIGRIQKPKPMPYLVDAVVLQIYLNSELDEVIALSKVDRRHHQISNTGVVWHRLAYLIQCRGQSFVLDYFKDPRNLSTKEIRRAVLRSRNLRRNWLTSTPDYRHIRYELPTDNAPDDIILHTEKYVVLSENRNIVVVDLKNNVRIGETPQTDLIRIRSFWNVELGVYFLTRLIAPGQLVFRILNLTLPEQNGTDHAEFTVVNDINLPFTGRVTFRHVTIDPVRRRLAACYIEEFDTDNKLFVVLDWATGKAVRLNTNVAHVAEKSSIGIDFPVEGDRLSFVSESLGAWCQRTFYVTDMEEHASDLSSDLTCKSVTPYAHQASLSYHERLSSSQRLYGGYVLSQWWPLYNDIPPVLTCIFILKDAATETWLMGQHYANETTPRTNRRTVVTMRDPVIEASGEPMVALQFNHFAWVDQEIVPREVNLSALGPLKKRVLRIAMFAEPERDLREGAIDGLTSEGITLDIPDEVLRNATYISLNISIAAVVIATKTKELHVYRFA